MEENDDYTAPQITLILHPAQRGRITLHCELATAADGRPYAFEGTIYLVGPMNEKVIRGLVTRTAAAAGFRDGYEWDFRANIRN